MLTLFVLFTCVVRKVWHHALVLNRYTIVFCDVFQLKVPYFHLVILCLDGTVGWGVDFRHIVKNNTLHPNQRHSNALNDYIHFPFVFLTRNPPLEVTFTGLYRTTHSGLNLPADSKTFTVKSWDRKVEFSGNAQRSASLLLPGRVTFTVKMTEQNLWGE